MCDGNQCSDTIAVNDTKQIITTLNRDFHPYEVFHIIDRNGTWNPVCKYHFFKDS